MSECCPYPPALDCNLAVINSTGVEGSRGAILDGRKGLQERRRRGFRALDIIEWCHVLDTIDYLLCIGKIELRVPNIDVIQRGLLRYNSLMN